jgi:hypothetical protein
MASYFPPQDTHQILYHKKTPMVIGEETLLVILKQTNILVKQAHQNKEVTTEKHTPWI